MDYVHNVYIEQELTMDGNCMQVYIVYMGHQPSSEPGEKTAPGGFSAAEAAHHQLLNRVLDDRSAWLLIFFEPVKPVPRHGSVELKRIDCLFFFFFLLSKPATPEFHFNLKRNLTQSTD